MISNKYAIVFGALFGFLVFHMIEYNIFQCMFVTSYSIIFTSLIIINKWIYRENNLDTTLILFFAAMFGTMHFDHLLRDYFLRGTE
jgi:hypothetical protein